MSEHVDLFHRLGDAPCAAIRRRVGELALMDRFRFRNVHFEAHLEALKAHGGDGTVPAIWDGEKLHVGEAACRARLDELAKG